MKPQKSRYETDSTSRQTMDELQIGNTKLWDLINKGELSVYKVGRTIRVTRESIDSFKKRHYLSPKSGRSEQ
ncbi:MAG: helix-turn-helix domain-containing protein [Candidatus Sedimenticola sp. (ex Thyasira tokunagai)]